MDRKTVTGAVLAAAVGAMFLTTPVFAQSSSGSSASWGQREVRRRQ